MCVYERERERERDWEAKTADEREIQIVCVRVCERERKREKRRKTMREREREGFFWIYPFNMFFLEPLLKGRQFKRWVEWCVDYSMSKPILQKNRSGWCWYHLWLARFERIGKRVGRVENRRDYPDNGIVNFGYLTHS